MKVLGAEHPQTLATSQNLARTLRKKGTLDDAESCLRLKESQAHSPDLVRTYSRLVEELFAEEPGYRERLLRFSSD